MKYFIIGADNSTTAVDFTGYINLIQFNYHPMTPAELLSNAFKYPPKKLEYDPYLISAFVVTDSNAAEYANTFYDIVNLIKFSYNSTSTQPQAVDLASDPISV
jgi:hypothetical protein